MSPLGTPRIKRTPAPAARLLAVLLPVLFFACPSFGAEEDGLPHHHVALFGGLGVETKDGHNEEGFAIGAEYELRFHRLWGVGGVVEFLGQDTVRNLVLVFPVSLHPGGGARIMFGPGVEFTPTKEKFAFRIGGSYEFGLGGHWSLSPELFVDLIESGASTWVAGVALGYEF